MCTGEPFALLLVLCVLWKLLAGENKYLSPGYALIQRACEIRCVCLCVQTASKYRSDAQNRVHKVFLVLHSKCIFSSYVYGIVPGSVTMILDSVPLI